MTALTISRFTSRIAVPARTNVTWAQLVNLLSDPCRTPCSLENCAGSACHHKDGGCWSPATFRPSSKYRSAKDVEAISCLVLDIDHVPSPAVDAMIDHLARYQHLLHSTHADRSDDRSLRVVVQLSRSVMPGEWSRFWPAAVNSLCAPADPVCGDVARLYYYPSCPRDADYFVAHGDGEALDVDALLEVPARVCAHQLFDASCHVGGPEAPNQEGKVS